MDGGSSQSVWGAWNVSDLPTPAKCLKVLDRSWIIKFQPPRTGNQHQHLTQSQHTAKQEKKNISLPSFIRTGSSARYFWHFFKNVSGGWEERILCKVLERLVLDLVSQWMLFSNRVPLTAGSVGFLQAILVLSQYTCYYVGPQPVCHITPLTPHTSQKNVRFARSVGHLEKMRI